MARAQRNLDLMHAAVEGLTPDERRTAYVAIIGYLASSIPDARFAKAVDHARRTVEANAS